MKILLFATFMLSQVMGIAHAVVCYAPNSCFYTTYDCGDFECVGNNTCTCNQLSSTFTLRSVEGIDLECEIIENMFKIRVMGTSAWTNLMNLEELFDGSAYFYRLSASSELNLVTFRFYEIGCITAGYNSGGTVVVEDCYSYSENINFEF